MMDLIFSFFVGILHLFLIACASYLGFMFIDLCSSKKYSHKEKVFGSVIITIFAFLQMIGGKH
jgi:hypothetical protein